MLKQLKEHKTQLTDHVRLSSGVQLAAWENTYDLVNVINHHHTLSLYVKNGYDVYKKIGNHWQNGGAPDHFCLMPEASESTWDIRGYFAFVHLYYTDEHLKKIASEIWDKEPNQIILNEKFFTYDATISLIYRNFLLKNNWHHTENHLQFSTATTLLLNHLLQNYSNKNWQLPNIKGGLSSYALKYILDWIDAHLSETLTLEVLAKQVHLSEYHFAHMFKHSMAISPHQYVLQKRLNKAQYLIQHSSQNLLDIALQCGFSSATHFSQQFKKQFGYAPSSIRKNYLQIKR